MTDPRQLRYMVRSLLLPALAAASFPAWPTSTVPGAPTGPIAWWENNNFSPPDAGPWLQENYLPVHEKQVANTLIRTDAIMQYSVMTLYGSGSERGEYWAKVIGDAFKPVTGISRDGIGMMIVRAEVMTGIKEDKWWKIPVRITFYAHAPINYTSSLNPPQ